MEKAYDIKELGKKLEAAGFPILKGALEESAGKVYVAVKEWAKESAVISENKVDDFAAPFYDQLDKIVLPQIDKIDGQVG